MSHNPHSIPQKRIWRVLGCAVAAVAVGIALAAAGAFFISDITRVPADADSRQEQAYLSDRMQDEEMLRALTEQLASDIDGEAAVFNRIAPAAGAPLGE